MLRFEGRVELQQVQLLSHQFKIASRVELFIGSPSAGAPVPSTGYDGVHFSRLGHFSLDINERSNFQARELKTVYVPQGTQGTHLRLVLHKCHVNEHNLYNQVGVLAVRAVGGPGAIAGMASPARNELAPAPTAAPVVGHPRRARRRRRRRPRPVVDAARRAARRRVRRDARRARAGKRRAVANEAYDEAKRLKERMAELRTLGAELPRWSARRCSPSPEKTRQGRRN